MYLCEQSDGEHYMSVLLYLIEIDDAGLTILSHNCIKIIYIYTLFPVVGRLYPI